MQEATINWQREQPEKATALSTVQLDLQIAATVLLLDDSE